MQQDDLQEQRKKQRLCLGSDDTLIPAKPKRPLSAYNLFFRSERDRYIEEARRQESQEAASANALSAAAEEEEEVSSSSSRRGAVFQHLSRHVVAKWNDLPDEERAKYEEGSKEDKRRYDREIITWQLKKTERAMMAPATSDDNKAASFNGLDAHGLPMKRKQSAPAALQQMSAPHRPVVMAGANHSFSLGSVYPDSSSRNNYNFATSALQTVVAPPANLLPSEVAYANMFMSAASAAPSLPGILLPQGGAGHIPPNNSQALLAASSGFQQRNEAAPAPPLSSFQQSSFVAAVAEAGGASREESLLLNDIGNRKLSPPPTTAVTRRASQSNVDSLEATAPPPPAQAVTDRRECAPPRGGDTSVAATMLASSKGELSSSPQRVGVPPPSQQPRTAARDDSFWSDPCVQSLVNTMLKGDSTDKGDSSSD